MKRVVTRVLRVVLSSLGESEEQPLTHFPARPRRDEAVIALAVRVGALEGKMSLILTLLSITCAASIGALLNALFA